MSTIFATGSGTATATAGAATLANRFGKITTESLTTAAAATYTLTITAAGVTADSLVFASVAQGTSTTGVPTIARVQPAANSIVIVVQNIASAAAFNGTLVISYGAFGA